MTRVIEIIADSSLSGAPRHLLTLLNGLKGDFEIEVICPEGWLTDNLKKIGIKRWSVPMKSYSDHRSAHELKKIIEESNPDIIHLHGIRAGWLGLNAKINSQAKRIYTEHLYTFDYHLKNPLREKLQIRGLKKITKWSHIIIVPSMAVEQFLVGGLQTPAKKIRKIYNGLDDYVVKNHPKDKTFGFVGTLNELKGVSILIESVRILAKRYPNLRLEIIGDGPLRDRLEKEAKDLPNIEFIGRVDEILPYLERWNFLVAPSLSESFGQVVVEAAIARLPVIASAAGGLKEVVIDGKTGILVERGDVDSLAEAIGELLRSPEEAREMGIEARKLYEKSFTAAKMISEVKNTYDEVLKNDR